MNVSCMVFFVVLFFKELFIKESMNILFIITQHMFIRKSLSEALEDKHLFLIQGMAVSEHDWQRRLLWEKSLN